MAGSDADLTVVSLKREEPITRQWIASRAGWTPYDGMTIAEGVNPLPHLALPPRKRGIQYAAASRLDR